MKKKFLSGMLAAAVLLTSPVSAFAANSVPAGDTAETLATFEATDDMFPLRITVPATIHLDYNNTDAVTKTDKVLVKGYCDDNKYLRVRANTDAYKFKWAEDNTKTADGYLEISGLDYEVWASEELTNLGVGSAMSFS